MDIYEYLESETVERLKKNIEKNPDVYSLGELYGVPCVVLTYKFNNGKHVRKQYDLLAGFLKDEGKDYYLSKLVKEYDKLCKKIESTKKQKGAVFELELEKRKEDALKGIVLFIINCGPIDFIKDPVVRKMLKDITMSSEFYHIELPDPDEFCIQDEIGIKVNPYIYLSRQQYFRSIIVPSKLPNKFYECYSVLKNHFLFGQVYGAVGFCRILLEIAFEDQYKIVESKVIPLEHCKFSFMAKTVCARRNKLDLREESIQLYRDISKILHGEDIDSDLNEKEAGILALYFILKTFRIIEKLYDV